MTKKHIASISGGRTSHYMVSALVEKFGKDSVDLVFCDTGAEHEGTYDFVRSTAKYFDMEITCLRLHMPEEKGVGGKYVVVPLETISADYKPFKELMSKYGRPFNPGGKFCTDQLKTKIYRKYCDDVYGKGGYTTWIGYRDEPNDSSRVWGNKLSITLSKWFNKSKQDQGDFYKECSTMLDKSYGDLFNFIANGVENSVSELNFKRISKIAERVVKNRQIGYRFLFEISDFDKTDILKWWRVQGIDLDIPKHCGNCVFCIEKTVNQLSYLCHTQKDLADEWKVIVTDPSISDKDRKVSAEAMYKEGHRKLSFSEIYDEAFEKPMSHWEDKVNHHKKLSPCASGACDLYSVEDL